MVKKPRVALVCDWLTTVGGAESVLLSLHEMYRDAPIYTSKYNPKGINWFKDADVRTGWISIFPNSMRRFIGPLRQFYFSHLDLSDYDLVISVTGAEAKAVKTSKVKGKDTTKAKTGKNRTQNKKTEQSEQPEHRCVHLCYCHVPTQYYWGMYDDYLKNPGFGVLNPLARLGLKLFVGPMRKKDYLSAQMPDRFITISSYAADQIKQFYHRDADIIYPPADIKKFSTKPLKFSTAIENNSGENQAKRKINYITTSRQVNWKKLEICVVAALRTGDNLTLIGDGPEHEKLVHLAGSAPNIKFLPTMSQEEVASHLAAADAFLFPSLEPFGLAPIEAIAAGLPVLAFKEGGAKDYIIPRVNGLFFESQTATALIKAMSEFKESKLAHLSELEKMKLKSTVEKFDKKYFKQKMEEIVHEKLV